MSFCTAVNCIDGRVQEQVVAFGDGQADIQMLRKAGLGVAIFPSNDEVRASADYVVGSEPIDRAIPVIEKHFKVGSSGFC